MRAQNGARELTFELTFWRSLKLTTSNVFQEFQEFPRSFLGPFLADYIACGFLHPSVDFSKEKVLELRTGNFEGDSTGF